MKLILRLLTLVCYILPFTFFLMTCNGRLTVSYNKQEASEAIKEVPLVYSAAYLDSIAALHDSTQILVNTPNTSVQDRTGVHSQSGKMNFGEYAVGRMIFPTNTSVSGIGIVYIFKNLAGRIAVATSFAMSLFLLVLSAFSKLYRLRRGLAIINLGSLMVFLATCIYSDVTVLWGFWVAVVLVMLQIFFEFSEGKDGRGKIGDLSS